jgi:hypothetical protein
METPHLDLIHATGCKNQRLRFMLPLQLVTFKRARKCKYTSHVTGMHSELVQQQTNKKIK